MGPKTERGEKKKNLMTIAHRSKGRETGRESLPKKIKVGKKDFLLVEKLGRKGPGHEGG